MASPDLSDATAVFPMDVVNNGQYNDSYTLSGSVTLNLVGGGTVTVPVLYYAPDGSLLPRVSNDPASPDYNKFITPVIAPAPSTSPTRSCRSRFKTLTGDYTVTQNAVGNYSTIPMTDTNNVIRVAPDGNVAVAKFVAKSGVTAASNPVNGIDNPANFTSTGATGAKPAEDITYRIIAKNNYNTTISNFFLSDTVPANTLFKSIQLLDASGTVISTNVIYKVGSGAWGTTAPPPTWPTPA